MGQIDRHHRVRWFNDLFKKVLCRTSAQSAQHRRDLVGGHFSVDQSAELRSGFSQAVQYTK